MAISFKRGTCHFSVRLGALALACASVVPAQSANVSAIAGWNLLGHGGTTTFNVNDSFGNANNVTTVWKWNASNSTWAFYSPALSDGGQAYAASKGYTFLTTINSGDGFWVNAKAAFSATMPDNPMIGVWTGAGTVGATSDVFFTFTPDGRYMMAQGTVIPNGGFTVQQQQIWPGLEYGTYTSNSTSSALVFACPTVDTNGTAGTSGTAPGGYTSYKGDPIGIACPAEFRGYTTSIVGDTMTLSGSGGSFTFNRVISKTDPIVGAWTGAGTAGASSDVFFTFTPDGRYMMTQATTPAEGGFTVQQLQVWPGLEYGTYTRNSTSGALEFACPTVDTNGTAGTSGIAPGGYTAYKGDPIGSACPAASKSFATTIVGDTMTLSKDGGTFTLYRVK